MPGFTEPASPIGTRSRTASTSIRRFTAAASAAPCSIAWSTESEARGFRQMVAVIGDSAQIPSIALHRAAGFRMVGTFEAVGFKFGRWLDTVMMQRALGEGAGTMP